MGIDTLLLGWLSAEQRRALRKWRRRATRPVRLGTLRSRVPLSDHFGADRGTPIDRYYIERFLAQHSQDIRGRVLEIKDPLYISRFGSGVTEAAVLDIDAGNPNATIICDLSAADRVPANQFQCFVLTQTLHMLYDVHGAVHHAHRILQPGGILLVTVPVTSRIMPGNRLDNDFWRFTEGSCQRLFGDVFGPSNIQVRPYGNLLSSLAFLAGMAREELSARELDTTDPYYPVVIALRAVKHSDSGTDANGRMRDGGT